MAGVMERARSYAVSKHRVNLINHISVSMHNKETSLLSPYLNFTREEWGHYRLDTPLLLSEKELEMLHGQIETVSRQEVEQVYLPLSRLLSLYVTTTEALYRTTGDFLGNQEPKVPFILGIAGSVAVGKSTTARVLQALLARWPGHPRVDLVTTDGFLFPNRVLKRRGLMQRKGFPERSEERRVGK